MDQRFGVLLNLPRDRIHGDARDGPHRVPTHDVRFPFTDPCYTDCVGSLIGPIQVTLTTERGRERKPRKYALLK